MKNRKTKVFTLLLLILGLNVFGQYESDDYVVPASESGYFESSEEASKFILHHVKDAHEWHIYGEGEKAVHLALPIILLDEGLKVFSSDKFSNKKLYISEKGDSTSFAVTEDGKYAIFHEKIYFYEGGLKMDEHNHPVNSKPLDFSITRNVASMMLSAVLLLLIFGSVAKAYKKRGVESAPRKLQSWMEPLVLFVRDEIAKPNIGDDKYQKFMPYLLTAFFFIWINNLLGLVPIFPGASNLTGNIAFTLVMAVITFIITSINGNKGYWSHILLPPVPKALYPIMIPVEVIGMFTKPFALMVRLFANITAGHIVVLAFICVMFINKSAGWAGLSVPMALFISVLELLVAFLQAFIFTMLSALFIGTAVEDHAHH